MKDDFAKVAKKIHLFSQRATVLSYSFGEVCIKTTSGNVIVKNARYDGNTGAQAILAGLAKENIPHEVIAKDETAIHLAVPRSKKEDALQTIDAALHNGVRLAVNFSMIQEGTDSSSPILDAIARPFSPLRREVEKSLLRLGS